MGISLFIFMLSVSAAEYYHKKTIFHLWMFRFALNLSLSLFLDRFDGWSVGRSLACLFAFSFLFALPAIHGSNCVFVHISHFFMESLKITKITNVLYKRQHRKLAMKETKKRRQRRRNNKSNRKKKYEWRDECTLVCIWKISKVFLLFTYIYIYFLFATEILSTTVKI